jgi:hypothetical protein
VPLGSEVSLLTFNGVPIPQRIIGDQMLLANQYTIGKPPGNRAEIISTGKNNIKGIAAKI